jgi:lipopolysaccharide biosynthesis glycosyltransferase
VNSQAIHVAFASDAEGVEGLAVTGFSALKRSSRPMHFWVIEDGISQRVQRDLEALWKQCPTFEGSTFIPMSSLPIAMPTRWVRKGWPLTAAARFQLPEMLPPEVTRCIYLDIDILVGTDLAELFDLDLQGRPIGMVLNTRMADNVKDYLRSISLDPEAYCNSGVLLMDLAAWRRETAGKGLIECGIGLPANIWFFDQDMLNTYFKNRCAFLDERWNYRDAGASPEGKVLHFAGAAKPWRVTAAAAVLRGHVDWHEARRQSGYKPVPVPPWIKWKKSVDVLVAKLQRRLA